MVLSGQSGQQCCLASGASTDVDPRPIDIAGVGQGSCHQLGSFVLHAGSSVGDCRHLAWISGAVRAESGVLTRARPLGEQFVDRGESGPHDEGGGRGDVVGHEGTAHLVAASSTVGRVILGIERFVARQQLCVLRHDPSGVQGGDGKLFDRVVGGNDLGPLGKAVQGDLAGHGIDQSSDPLPDDVGGKIHRGADSGVRRHPHLQDLVAGHPQDDAHPRLQRAGRTSTCSGDDAVPTPGAAGRTVHQFGGEGGIAPGECAHP